jgi:secondary thiamine-phosphate synthase enzyme
VKEIEMESLLVETAVREVFVDVTARVAEAVARAGLKEGAALIYVPHTTAGVTVNENADPSVRRDLGHALRQLVPADLPFEHLEGNADAHVKASLVGSSALVPVSGGRLQLGTWQGIYFAEFDGPRRRRLYVQPLGGA